MTDTELSKQENLDKVSIQETGQERSAILPAGTGTQEYAQVKSTDLAVESNSDDSYFEINRTSNSLLSFIDPLNDGSPRKYQAAMLGNWEKKESSSMQLGSHIHRYFLEPDKFCVIDVPKPESTTKIGMFTDAYIEYMTSPGFAMQRGGKAPLILDAEAFRYARNKADFSAKFTDDTIRKQFNDSGKPYYEALLQNKGKTFLTAKEKTVITQVVENVKSKNTVLMWLSDDYANVQGWETHNEIAILSDLVVKSMLTDKEVSIPFKGKLDRVIVDHDRKVVYLIDLKTTGSGVYNFNKSIRIYNYDRQMALYAVLLRQRYPDYDIQIKFIVVQTTGINDVVIGSMGSSWLTSGLYNAHQLLTRLAFHISEDKWDESIEEIVGGGELSFEKPQFLY